MTEPDRNDPNYSKFRKNHADLQTRHKRDAEAHKRAKELQRLANLWEARPDSTEGCETFAEWLNKIGVTP